MMKILFFSMIFSFFLKWKNFFIVLLSLELGVLYFLFFFSSFLNTKFIFILFVFVMGSILGLIIFLLLMKKFSNFQTSSWYF